MNFTLSFIVFLLIAVINYASNSLVMISATMKTMIAVILIGSILSFNADNPYYLIACIGAVFFGFCLHISHLRRKRQLTFGTVMWNLLTTCSVSFFMTSLWYARFDKFDNFFIVYLFICSFMSVVIANQMYVIFNTNIKAWKTRVARFWLLDNDKEDKKP